MTLVLDTEENEAPRERSRGGRRPELRRLAPVLLPVCICVLALWAPAFVFHTEPRAMGTGLGPAAWPRGILALLALMALAWALRDLWAIAVAGRGPSLTAAHEEESYAWGKAALGLGLIVAYGALLPWIGFATATVAFMSIWCLAGGLRNPLAIGGVALCGTVGLLWMFMGLALMPLSRGQGVFNDFSIALLRFLGIY
ncbi:tripartite tricarboxylate transporter TctB family protein [Jannaschia formosa]|uniref:tripartite tricarboxylate transporter TctB family protein n=1 Tax=Jannaschia formosa TaxID=2259592 RepID=UPI000E1B5F87|nr:tripartite tricarboxylate transporter TctB family protein [Jannaschia formosa]TFL17838.1 tripartite tricarboxylate transporter TctB family protein [Jannaschia formosa]